MQKNAHFWFKGEVLMFLYSELLLFSCFRYVDVFSFVSDVSRDKRDIFKHNKLKKLVFHRKNAFAIRESADKNENFRFCLTSVHWKPLEKLLKSEGLFLSDSITVRILILNINFIKNTYIYY